MNIIDNDFPIDPNDVALSKLTIVYKREFDCTQCESDYPGEDGQTLTITTDDGGGGKFIRFNTGESGWSIDNVDEMVTIINDFKKRLSCES